jgi:8-oxo-dGTP diphosphatase
MAEKGEYTYPFPRPMVTADALVYTNESPRRVLLVQRKHAPWEGHWAMPGGFCEIDETLEQAVERELEEETGITGLKFEQFKTVSTVDRDPRGRVITTVFLAEANPATMNPKASDDAAAVQWWPMDNLPAMAADHGQIIYLAREQLEGLRSQNATSKIDG